MAFEGLSSRLQEITRKIRGKARITESDLKEMFCLFLILSALYLLPGHCQRRHAV